MIVRIVTMYIQEIYLNDFKHIFCQIQPTIASFDGCRSLKLLQSIDNPTVLTTYSVWESEAHLDAYRHSDFFSQTWKTVKPLFYQKTQAQTYTEQ